MYKLIFAYDGSDFYGSASQLKKRTVEGELLKVLTKINNGKDPNLNIAGRTDRGVHALAQVASFDLAVPIKLSNVKRSISSSLPDDIHVIKLVLKENFHARYMAKRKEYTYYLNIGEYNPFKRKYEYQYNMCLNISAMKKAIKLYEGVHDFKNFTSKEAIKTSYVRTIYKTKLTKKSNIIAFTFEGDGFLQYQVRNMVGVLIKIGEGSLQIDDINKLFENDELIFETRCAPPTGLYLNWVKY